ncbi:unnamed protein product [Rhizopus stolonifer]
MMASHQHYQALSLPPIPIKNTQFQKHQRPKPHTELQDLITEIENTELRERIESAIQKTIFDWTEKHDGLIHTLNELEGEKTKIEHQYQAQSQCYKKAVKEVHLYRTRYDHLIRRYSLEGNIQMSGRNSVTSAVTASLLDDSIDSVSSKMGLNSDEDDEFDISSILSYPLNSSLIFPDSSIHQEDIDDEDEEQPRQMKDDTDTLIFACNDGFWGTISDEKTSKADVETLISNYLSRGGNPNVAKSSESDKIIKEGYSLVHALVATKNTNALRRVLQAGAKPNIYPLSDKLEEKITPLVLAAKVRHLNSIRALVEKSDADILNAKGPLGENVLHAAVENNSGEIVEYILKVSQNALLEKTDNKGATPLHYACITGRTRLITLFVKDRHASISPQDNKGATPLHYAVRHRQLKAVATLIELGACPNDNVPKQMPTPLDLAKTGGFENIADYLKRAGGKTTKELEKGSIAKKKSSSIFSGESSGSSDMSSANKSIKHYLQMKTTQILKGK